VDDDVGVPGQSPLVVSGGRKVIHTG
jgi:hypothetical protein